MNSAWKTAIKSVLFYKRAVVYQVLIITLLCGVITGSLLTGYSVRENLKTTASLHLGKTEKLISSGYRYMKPALAERLSADSSLRCAAILQINGYSQLFGSQKGAFNTNIIGITDSFFRFHGYGNIKLKNGEAAVNKRLADYLGIKPGDDIIVRYKAISDIPADAPFAPSGDGTNSVVIKAAAIIGPENAGNFSLLISQVEPFNIFINLTDLFKGDTSAVRINRIIVAGSTSTSSGISELLRSKLEISDIGLKIRPVPAAHQSEIISDRIFIDQTLLGEIERIVPSAEPVLTYMANSLVSAGGKTPYSFISAIPASLFSKEPSGDEIIINDWLASDQNLKQGDKLELSWYEPDSLNKLTVKKSSFKVADIKKMEGIWGDSLLMPEFPGIAGKASCSDWDAGIPVKMKDIRPADEKYWNNYRGAPKAFISYNEGKRLWASNFGPATAIRFTGENTPQHLNSVLSGSINPEKAGIIISDPLKDSIKAAEEGTDFGTLFLSLGFFLIVAAFILLSFAVSSYLNAKSAHVRTFYSLGYTRKSITRLFLKELLLISIAGCVLGSFAGSLVNILITKALNGVWTGAVQTDTLRAYTGFFTVVTGAVLTLLFILLYSIAALRRFVNRIAGKHIVRIAVKDRRRNLIMLIISFVFTIILFAASYSYPTEKLVFSFTGGAVLMVTIILAIRQYAIRKRHSGESHRALYTNPVRAYYSIYPNEIVLPVLFIATGLFSVYITGSNHLAADDNLRRSGGTGGYSYWLETTIPVKDDINMTTGRRNTGLDDSVFINTSFVQMKRFAGSDASCLNLNHVSVPPLLGADVSDFISKDAFSFTSGIKVPGIKSGWQYLNMQPGNNLIYGIADQTVLEWGLKLHTGDTLVIRAESGQKLGIIIAAALQSSVFQGNILIGSKYFSRYFPSVSGSSVFLVDSPVAEKAIIASALTKRLDNYGPDIISNSDRLAAFSKVTNTYLSVFSVFGFLGMITGVAGLGFVLLKNYNNRRKEFALLMATGFSAKHIRRMLLRDQIFILLAGVFTGLVSALAATLPTINAAQKTAFIIPGIMTLLIIATGSLALIISLRRVTGKNLLPALRKE